MNPVQFDGSNITFAKNQPPYRPLPAHCDLKSGRVTSCWRLTIIERLRVLLTGQVWVQVLANGPLQPLKLAARNPLV